MEFTKKDPLIILIAGKAGSGKTTLSNTFKKLFENKGIKLDMKTYFNNIILFFDICF